MLQIVPSLIGPSGTEHLYALIICANHAITFRKRKFLSAVHHLGVITTQSAILAFKKAFGLGLASHCRITETSIIGVCPNVNYFNCSDTMDLSIKHTEILMRKLIFSLLVNPLGVIQPMRV